VRLGRGINRVLLVAGSGRTDGGSLLPLRLLMTYTVWLRGYAPNGAGDSVFVSLDDQPVTTLTGFVPRQWSWATENGSQAGLVTVEVTEPGLHTLYLWQREDGLRLDRIVLTADSGYNPGGNGPPESETR
jgi:hypothetical protein